MLLHWVPDPQAFILFGGFAVAGPWAGDDAELTRAVDLARDAEVAVVVVGTSEAVESEGTDRTDLVLVLVCYVVPLLGAAVLLVLVGLGGLAAALLAVEVVVASVTFAVRRRPARPAGPARRPWLVPLAMLAVLALLGGVAVLAAR